LRFRHFSAAPSVNSLLEFGTQAVSLILRSGVFAASRRMGRAAE
jgi:hypothetical protein